MNKNLLIIGAIVLAAAAGFFAKSFTGADLSYDYADCIKDCEEAHTNRLASIYQTYDQCVDNASESSLEDFLKCFDEGPCKSAPQKPPCQTCKDRAGDIAGEKIADCRKVKNEALAAEDVIYRKCRSICNAMISFSENPN